MLYVPFSLPGSLFSLRGDLEREHFLKKTKTNCSNDGPVEKMEMHEHDDKYDVWLCFSHFNTTVCSMLRTASFWKNGDFSIVTVFKNKTSDSKQKNKTKKPRIKNLNIFHSWWINKIWLLKLALATQMSFRYFLWCVYVWHSCKVCAIPFYPVSYCRKVSKFLQTEAAAELKTMSFSKNNVLWHRRKIYLMSYAWKIVI